MTKNISYFSIMYFSIFIIPILLILHKLKINLVKRSIISIGRMIVQLSLVGIYLQYIFLWDNPYINIGYLLIMILAATLSIGKSVNIRLKKIFPIIYLTSGIPLFILLIFFGYFLIGLDNPLEAKYMIPISGMMLGNTLNGNIITLNTFFKTFRNNEEEYLYSLGLGASKQEALSPYIKEALHSSIAPTLAGVATMGIVSLPGMMTGQILGGSLPITAIKYQIAIMLAIFSCKFFSCFMSIFITSKVFFDDYHILNKDIFLKDNL